MVVSTLMALLLVISSASSHADGNALADSSACGDVQTYLQNLDRMMFDGMSVYLEDDAWVDDMERMSRKANANETGILTLTEEEMQPLLDIISVPGDILLDYPEDDIPEAVRPLHDSSMSYWLIMPAMLRSIVSGGVFSTVIFADDLETAIAKNSAAIKSLQAECPNLVEEMSSDSVAGLYREGLENFESLDLDAIEDHHLRGFAFSILTLPAGEADGDDAFPVVDPSGDSKDQSVDYSNLPRQQSPIIKADGELDDLPTVGNMQLHTGIVLGEPDAPVTMHIYSDFQCHFCKSFHDDTLPQIIDDFVRTGQVKLVFHDFPRLGTDPGIADPDDVSAEIDDPNNESAQAAHAAMCAEEQGEYLEYSDRLFENYGGIQQGAYSRSNLNRLAEAQGLDMSLFNSCMDSERYLPAITASVEQGQANGITAIPMFILDNGSGEPKVIQQTAEGYSLMKKQIELSISTAQ